MKPILEQKLRELIDEADRQIAPALSTTLRILLGACLEGKQNDFAKHCTKFSPLVINGISVQTQAEAEDGWIEAISETYVH